MASGREIGHDPSCGAWHTLALATTRKTAGKAGTELVRALRPCSPMNTRVSRARMLATAVFFVATSAVGHAHARTCESPDDCPMGFDCVGAGADGGPAGACYSLGCSAESDCGPGLRCASSGSTICIPEPEGGSSCSSNACVPQWDAPCTADVDCGPGFTCSGSGEDDEIACTPDA